MAWIEIIPIDKNTGSSYGRRKVYGLDGKQYPRISIGVIRDKNDTMHICCSEKYNRKSWWETVPMPISLAEDLIAMIRHEIEVPTKSPDQLTDDEREKIYSDMDQIEKLGEESSEDEEEDNEEGS